MQKWRTAGAPEEKGWENGPEGPVLGPKWARRAQFGSKMRPKGPFWAQNGPKGHILGPQSGHID